MEGYVHVTKHTTGGGGGGGVSLNSTSNVLNTTLVGGRVNRNRTEDIALVRIVSLNGRVCTCN